VPTLAAGTLVDERYEILASVGHGGMGHVYRARHLGLDKQVALKVLELDSSGDAHARFAREARALARLDHPGCVRVLDHGHGVDGTAFIALDLVDGPTLGSALASAGRFDTARALELTRQILLALAHAHAHGVIHRDLKPDNILLASRGRRVVLIDFGLASLADEAAMTARGMCIGSPSYIAPERLLGQPHDTRTDLYAVGVILYELVAGTRPFARGPPRETMAMAIHRPPRPLRAVRRDISPALDRLITRALAKDPARRFTDTDEMLLALADVEDELARSAASLEADAAATLAFGQLQVREPSWVARLWSRLRYGTWRWRARMPEPGDSLTG